MNQNEINAEILTIKSALRTADNAVKLALTKLLPIQAEVSIDCGLDCADIINALTSANDLLEDARDFLHHKEILATTAAQDAA